MVPPNALHRQMRRLMSPFKLLFVTIGFLVTLITCSARPVSRKLLEDNVHDGGALGTAIQLARHERNSYDSILQRSKLQRRVKRRLKSEPQSGGGGTDDATVPSAPAAAPLTGLTRGGSAVDYYSYYTDYYDYKSPSATRVLGLRQIEGSGQFGILAQKQLNRINRLSRGKYPENVSL